MSCFTLDTQIAQMHGSEVLHLAFFSSMSLEYLVLSTKKYLENTNNLLIGVTNNNSDSCTRSRSTHHHSCESRIPFALT